MLGGGARPGGGRQYFDATAAQAQALMLMLASVALVMPAIFQLVIGGSLPSPTEREHHFGGDLEWMSALVAVVLLLSYVAGLVFSLKTHRDLFNPPHDEDDVDDRV